MMIEIKILIRLLSMVVFGTFGFTFFACLLIGAIVAILEILNGDSVGNFECCCLGLLIIIICILIIWAWV